MGQVVDRSGEYVWRIAILWGAGGLALMLTALMSSNAWVGYVGMCLYATAVVIVVFLNAAPASADQPAAENAAE